MRYKIVSIRHSGKIGTRGFERVDGRYPDRVGRIVDFNIDSVDVGKPLILEYLEKADGSDYKGYWLQCSLVTGIHFVGDEIGCVETLNSIYELQKCK